MFSKTDEREDKSTFPEVLFFTGNQMRNSCLQIAEVCPNTKRWWRGCDGAAVSRRRRGSSAEIVRSFSFCVYF